MAMPSPRRSSELPTDIVWRMDDEYQRDLLDVMRASITSMAKAKLDPTHERVREAWAVTEELCEIAIPFVPRDFYDAAKEWLSLGRKLITMRDYSRAIYAISKARYNIIAGLRKLGVVGKVRLEREDVEDQARKLLLEAIEKHKAIKKEKEEVEKEMEEEAELTEV